MDTLIKTVTRDLRKNQTKAEKIFWQVVRKKNILGFRFLRQHPILFTYDNRDRFFITDFYCHKRKLVIEIDGEIHKYQQDYDELRTHIINKLGFTVIRFKNEEIEQNLANCIKKLEKFLQ